MTADHPRVMPGTTHRNGMPPSVDYVYKGSGYDQLASPAQIAAVNRARVRARRAADGRCEQCGYLPGSIGCQAECGGAQ